MTVFKCDLVWNRKKIESQKKCTLTRHTDKYKADINPDDHEDTELSSKCTRANICTLFDNIFYKFDNISTNNQT